MKHLFTKCLLVLTFIFIFGLLSCDEELYEDTIQNNSRNLKITQKPFKELLLLNDFNKAYEKVKTEKQKNNALRSALEEEYNFTI